jgi:hypothetical protein
MIKNIKMIGAATKAAAGAFKAKCIETKDMFKDRAYLDKLFEVFDSLPEGLVTDELWNYAVECVVKFETEYKVSYKAPYEALDDDCQLTIDDVEYFTDEEIASAVQE